MWKSLCHISSILSFVFAFILMGSSNSVYAQQEIDLGTFKDWSAQQYEEDGKVCNMWSRPKQNTDGANRQELYAFVTHRPLLSERDAISFQMGQDLRDDQDVLVTIGNKVFKAVAQGESVFITSDQEAQPLIDAMKKGTRMTVEAVSQQGKKLRDVYSLSGFTASHRKISATCK